MTKGRERFSISGHLQFKAKSYQVKHKLLGLIGRKLEVNDCGIQKVRPHTLMIASRLMILVHSSHVLAQSHRKRAGVAGMKGGECHTHHTKSKLRIICSWDLGKAPGLFLLLLMY